MTALAEEIDLSFFVVEQPKCMVTINGEPCDNDAEWSATVLPCGCRLDVCTPCKERSEAVVNIGRWKGLLVHCSRCMHNVDSLRIYPL